MIVFEKRKLKTKLKNPLKNFDIEKQEIEFRKDPLTGRWSRININRTRRIKQVSKDEKFLRKVIKDSKRSCTFCENRVEKLTPKFVDLKERIRVGSSILFPNLFPYSFYHGVAVLSTKKHYLSLRDINPNLLFNALKNSIEFFRIANEKSPNFKYPSINFNFMPPAGASLVHPHLQILLDDKLTFFTNLLIKKSLIYFKRFKSNFWLDLIKEEENGPRFIGKIGSFSWLTDFSPVKNNQVSGIISERISSVTDLKDENIRDLSLGLSKIFKKFYRMKVGSLNMCIFSGPIGKDISEYFVINLKIISRPALAQVYASDIGFMELIHQESVVETLPEDVAKSLRFYSS